MPPARLVPRTSAPVMYGGLATRVCNGCTTRGSMAHMFFARRTALRLVETIPTVAPGGMLEITCRDVMLGAGGHTSVVRRVGNGPYRTTLLVNLYVQAAFYVVRCVPAAGSAMLASCRQLTLFSDVKLVKTIWLEVLAV
jgi:hypothetical protein